MTEHVNRLREPERADSAAPDRPCGQAVSAVRAGGSAAAAVPARPVALGDLGRQVDRRVLAIRPRVRTVAERYSTVDGVPRALWPRLAVCFVRDQDLPLRCREAP